MNTTQVYIIKILPLFCTGVCHGSTVNPEPKPPVAAENTLAQEGESPSSGIDRHGAAVTLGYE